MFLSGQVQPPEDDSVGAPPELLKPVRETRFRRDSNRELKLEFSPPWPLRLGCLRQGEIEFPLFFSSRRLWRLPTGISLHGRQSPKDLALHESSPSLNVFRV
jgi:hypothetical protein